MTITVYNTPRRMEFDDDWTYGQTSAVTINAPTGGSWVDGTYQLRMWHGNTVMATTTTASLSATNPDFLLGVITLDTTPLLELFRQWHYPAQIPVHCTLTGAVTESTATILVQQPTHINYSPQV